MGARIKLFLFLSFLSSNLVGANPKGTKDHLIKMDGVVVPMVVRHESLANVLLNINILVTNDNKLFLAKQLIPRLRDSFIEELYIALPLIWDGESQLNLEAIRQRLQVAASKAAPKGLISGIYITYEKVLNNNKEVGIGTLAIEPTGLNESSS